MREHLPLSVDCLCTEDVACAAYILLKAKHLRTMELFVPLSSLGLQVMRVGYFGYVHLLGVTNPHRKSMHRAKGRADKHERTSDPLSCMLEPPRINAV